MAARRAAAVLALALAARAKEFDMGGQCAAVFKEQKWIAEDADGVRSHQWDYKIIVSPWTVFGKARATASAASCAGFAATASTSIAASVARAAATVAFTPSHVSSPFAP